MNRLKIKSLANINFGLHQDKSLSDFEHDFVVVYGKNESGKSTIAEFISWTIAGPWRSAAEGSARFQTKSGNTVSGRLIADLGNEKLDIDSIFRIRGNGKPADERTATIGKRPVQGDQIKNILNQLTPDDYRWIYSVNGVDLSRSQTADDFSDLFSSFTTGISTGGMNLREILRLLETEKNARKRAVDDLKRAIKSTSELRNQASLVPETLKGLNRAKDEQDEIKEEIDLRITSLVAERSEVQLALRAVGAKSKFETAERVLQELEPVPADWQSVLPLFDELCRLQKDIDRISALEVTAFSRMRVAISKRSFEDSEVQGRVFTADDRLKLRELFTEVSGNENLANLSVAEITKLNSKLAQVEESISGLLNVSGAEHGLVPLLRNQSSVLDSLKLQASLWAAAATESESQRAIIAGLEVPQIPDTATDSPVDSLPERSFVGIQFVVSLVAVCVAAFFEPAAGVGAAVLAVAAFFLFGKRGKTPKSVASQAVTNLSNIPSNLNNEKFKLATLTSKENDFEVKILEALRIFGVTSVNSITVRSQIDMLVDLSKAVDEKYSLEFAIASENKKFGEISVDLVNSRDLLRAALSAIDVRNIPESEEFESWLADYEEAVISTNQVSELRSEVSVLVEKCNDYLAPIAETIKGLPWSVVKTQFEQVVSLHESVSKAQSELREAKIEFNAAGGDSPKVEALLQEHPSKIQLELFESGLVEKLSDLKITRDEALRIWNKLDGEIGDLKSQEVLQSLNLQLSELEENMAEAENQLKIHKIAFEVYGKVIERFEKDNQDPLIKEAQNFISEVVDQWGDLLFTRDVRGKVQIDRDGQGGKLPQSSLSEGARALLFLGIRLAFVNKDAEKRGIRLPILCDDPFIHFDDSRRDTAIKLFGSIALENQVILFTCEESTRDLAISNGAHLINL